MKKLLLGLVCIMCFGSAALVAAQQQVTELPNGRVKYEVTYSEPKDYVEVFIKKNELQILAQDITNSFRSNGDGTFSYQLIHGGYVAGDVITARFYSHINGVQNFTPASFSPDFVNWNNSLIYTNPAGGSPFITELANGKILFTLKTNTRQDYVEIFVRKNGIQMISQEITANHIPSQGAYEFTDTGYKKGDKIEVRFYTHANGAMQFIPGRAEQVWSAHNYGTYPNATLATQDATYTLGVHKNANGVLVHTEAYFDIGFDYLTPFSSSAGLATSWIVDRALAQSFNQSYLLNTVEFKGLYVRHCTTGAWVNVNNTVYAPLQPPLLLGSWMFSLNHHYANTLSNVLLDANFACPNVPVKLTNVLFDGRNQSVLAKGRVHFVYVVEHR
jgi:uncharacterized protein YxeA